MSHTNVIYPQSTNRTASWQIREDGDDYGNSKGNSGVQTVSLLDLHDRVIDRLDRAKALSQLLHTADIQLEHVVRDTALVLEEHIEQAQRTSRRMWEYIQRERRGS